MYRYTVKTLRGEIRYRKAPDGKWGCAVVMAGFFIFGISYSISKTLGYYFLYFQDEFQTNNYQTSWIMSITLSMYGVGAPFSAMLQQRYGARKIIMFGGLLCLCGLAIASLSTSIYTMYLGIGVISGVGFSCGLVSVISQVGLYFDKYVGIATGITSTGTAVCSAIMPFLAKYTLEKYGWRGSMLIYSGLGFNVTMFGALVRPITAITRPKEDAEDIKCTKQDDTAQGDGNTEAMFILFKNFIHKYWFVFLFFGVSELLVGLTLFVPYVYIVPYAKELGMTDLQAAQLLSISSIVDIIGRPLGGLIISLVKPIGNNIILFLSGIMLCLALIQVLPINFTSYSAMLVYATFYGAIFGLFVVTSLSSVKIISGGWNLQRLFALKYFCSGLSTLVGPPIAGYLVDQGGSYRAVYWYCGVGMCITSLLNVLCHVIVKKRHGIMVKH